MEHEKMQTVILSTAQSLKAARDEWNATQTVKDLAAAWDDIERNAIPPGHPTIGGLRLALEQAEKLQSYALEVEAPLALCNAITRAAQALKISLAHRSA